MFKTVITQGAVKTPLPMEASTKKNEPVRARANFLAWLGINSFLLTISSAATTTTIPLPFYIICLLTILLHVPKCLFLSRMASKTRILPHKLAFRMPKLNGIMLLPGSEDRTLPKRVLS